MFNFLSCLRLIRFSREIALLICMLLEIVFLRIMKILGFQPECAQVVQIFHVFISTEIVILLMITMVVRNDLGVLALLLVKYVLERYEFSVIYEHHIFDLRNRIG